MDLITLLLNPKVLAILGPLGVLCLVIFYSSYKVIAYLFKRYDEIQEKRIHEAQEMQKEYLELASDIDKTLNLLIKTVSKRNGNGNGK